MMVFRQRIGRGDQRGVNMKKSWLAGVLDFFNYLIPENNPRAMCDMELQDRITAEEHRGQFDTVHTRERDRRAEEKYAGMQKT